MTRFICRQTFNEKNSTYKVMDTRADKVIYEIFFQKLHTCTFNRALENKISDDQGNSKAMGIYTQKCHSSTLDSC